MCAHLAFYYFDAARALTRSRAGFGRTDAYKISSQTDTRPTRGGYRLRDLLIEIAPGGGVGSTKAEEEKSGCDSPGGGVGDGTTEGATGGGRGGGGGGSLSARRRGAFRRMLVSARAR